MALLGRRARDLEQELSHLRLETASGTQALGIGKSSLTLRQIQQQLPGDLTLLSYHLCGDEVLAFVVTQEAIRVVRHMATPAAVEEQIALLAAHWNHLRMSGIFIERHMAALERNAQRILQRLYHALVAPLAEIAGLEVGDPLQRLVIVPHGLLHQVPFQALYDGERYLIEMAELSYAPSATILTLCQERMARPWSRLLVMGVADPAIPAVEAETRAIAQTFPEAEILMNEQANLGDLRSNVSRCAILHLACHGVFRADNPMFSALKLYDGWLTAAESVQLDLDGALVVLSACESGRGAVLAGDETIGLVRAFLGAGAATLAVSQWLVQDDTGAMLMAEWYARLARGQSLTASLRAAQLALKSSHPHPYYWAPFVLIGSRGVPFNGRA
jgi:CHAT domain-containing protein